MSNSPKRRGGSFRAASVTRHDHDSVEFRVYLSGFKKARPADTIPGRTAREWFAFLRPLVLGSRPMLSHGKRTKRLADGQMHAVAPVFGPPTFRNVIDENGRHV